MKRLVKTLGGPTVLTTDKASSLTTAFKKLKGIGLYKVSHPASCSCLICVVKF